MQKGNTPELRKRREIPFLAMETIGAAILAVVMLLLPVLFTRVSAQSGRRPPPAATPSPSADGTTSDQDEQTANNGMVAGEGETVEGDTLTVNTALVRVPLTVMDRNGKYVPNLTRRDFHVFENGVEQRIAYFSKVDQPFTVVLLIDTSNSTHFKMEDIQNAAISFINQLKDEDRVMVMSFDDSIRTLCDATSDRDTLIQAIRRTRTGGGTRLYDAVDQVIQQKLKSISGRKAVVVFTDGVDTTSRHASYRSTIKEVEESDAAVYSVAYDTSQDVMGGGMPGHGGVNFPFPGTRGSGGRYPGAGPGATTGEYRTASEYLHEIASESGGQYYRGDTIVGLSAAFSELADELRRQYSIGYYPPAGEAGQRRDIKVRVNQPGFVVKARDNYIYSQPAKDNSAKDSKQ
ncbi:MAG TPA: VWA domain-containing protein [Pyrinomonadaceae bacterium]|nr:VWA domain-containing protein [Pyrinomonadaceae bacterium]